MTKLLFLDHRQGLEMWGLEISKGRGIGKGMDLADTLEPIAISWGLSKKIHFWMRWCLSHMLASDFHPIMKSTQSRMAIYLWTCGVLIRILGGYLA